ncbi:hypothetical protein, partial [Nocardioides sp. ChNu-99]
TPGTPAAAAAPVAAGPAALEVDRGAAVAGRVLPFQATGLVPGRQVSVTFDDGAAAAGPFQVAADGSMAGVITLPADTPAGTHELRIFGLDEPLTVSFAVRAADDAAEVAASSDAAPAEDAGPDRLAVAFVVAAALVLLAAVARVVLVRTRAAR